MAQRSQPAGESAPSAVGFRTVALMTARALVVVCCLVTAYYQLPLDKPFSGGTALALVLGLIGVALVLVWQVRSIATSTHPRLRAVDALASTLPPYLLLFSAAYYLMERSEAGSFSQHLTRTDALYFSVTVFSSVGFGDITAQTQSARLIVVGQMIGDLVLLGLAARVLVGAVQEGVRRQGIERPDPPVGTRDGDGHGGGKPPGD